jgi:hypothetical protein
MSAAEAVTVGANLVFPAKCLAAFTGQGYSYDNVYEILIRL